MADATIEALKAQLRLLRLPTMGREFDKLARDAAAGNQTFAQFLLRLTELELATRAANAITSRIKDADFPVEKDFDTYDFTLMPQLSKPKILELARCEWITQKSNCCFVGSHGTGKTHIAIGLGLAACRGNACALLHGGRAGESPGKGAETVHAGPLSHPARSCALVDLRRTGLRDDEPRRCGTSISRFRRPLRAWQHSCHEQSSIQRVEPDFPGRADDHRLTRPTDPPLRNL